MGSSIFEANIFVIEDQVGELGVDNKTMRIL